MKITFSPSFKRAFKKKVKGRMVIGLNIIYKKNEENSNTFRLIKVSLKAG